MNLEDQWLEEVHPLRGCVEIYQGSSTHYVLVGLFLKKWVSQTKSKHATPPKIFINYL